MPAKHMTVAAWGPLILPGAPVDYGYVCLRGGAMPRDPATRGSLIVMRALDNALPFSLIVWARA